MSPTLRFLQKMRGRVPLYTGSNSVVTLGHFLRGFDCALNELEYKDALFSKFQKFVEKKFSCSVAQSWDYIIEFYCGDGEAGLTTFWNLVDEYLLVETANRPVQ